MSEGPGRLGEVGQGVETRTWGGQGLKHRQGPWGWAEKLGCGVVDRVQDGRELGSLKQAFKGSGSKWGSWLVQEREFCKVGVESPKAVPQSAGGIQTGASPVRRSWDSNHANHRHEKGGRSDALSSPIQEKKQQAWTSRKLH